MQSQDVAPQAPRPKSGSRSAAASGKDALTVDIEQAEAALVEHYPRLVRLAYLVLPPSLGRNRRVLTAHSLTQRALPRSRNVPAEGLLPGQRGEGAGSGRAAGYAYVRLQVLRGALAAGVPLSLRRLPTRAQLPALLPQVWGLRLFPRAGGADELALDQGLAHIGQAARAAFVLRGLERLQDTEIVAVLEAAGVAGARAALARAAAVPVPEGANAAALLASPEFDPCSLQARPPDLMRRRQHGRALIAGVAALAVCGALLVAWGGGEDVPAYARNPAQQAALDPGKVTTAATAAWRSSARQDFSVWPARGSLIHDRALLGRALTAWAAPSPGTQVSATPGTPRGGPAGPPQLLFAGRTPRARVVIFYDGLRVVRYAEAAGNTDGPPALDLARVDGADAGTSGAVVVDRADGNVRYLTAPWVKSAASRDLRRPQAPAAPLDLAADGTTGPFRSPESKGACTSWNTLETTGEDGTVRLSADLGELVPAHLTSGSPAGPREVGTAADRGEWAPSACSLAAGRAQGVRSVNSWEYARQVLPEAAGTAAWACTRMDTWQGVHGRVFAEFRAPGEKLGAIAARSENSAACGPRDRDVLAGALWKAPSGAWFVLAAGSDRVASIATSGDVNGSSPSRLLVLPAEKGDQAELTGALTRGGKLDSLR